MNLSLIEINNLLQFIFIFATTVSIHTGLEFRFDFFAVVGLERTVGQVNQYFSTTISDYDKVRIFLKHQTLVKSRPVFIKVYKMWRLLDSLRTTLKHSKQPFSQIPNSTKLYLRQREQKKIYWLSHILTLYISLIRMKINFIKVIRFL